MQHMTIERGRRTLFRLWLFSCGGLFLLLIGMSVGGALKDDVQEVWEWFLPMVMPTLMLMVSVHVYAPQVEGAVDKIVYSAAFWLSVVYLLVLFIPIITHPLNPDPMLEVILMSSLWLGPIQGLVASAIGAFFVKTRTGGGAGDTALHGGNRNDGEPVPGGSEEGSP